MKHKQQAVATALLGNKPSDKQIASPLDKTQRKNSSVPIGQSNSGKIATSKPLSPLKQSHASATDNLNLGSARGGNDLSLFSPVSSRKQKRSQKKNEAQTQKSEEPGYTSDCSDATPKRVTSFKTRLSVNFFVPPAEHDANVKLYTAAKKWMAKVLECDNISLLPWYKSDMCEDRIRKVADIPTSLFMFKKYFQRANPNEKGGKVYTDVMITHTKPMEVIVGDLSWF